MRKKSMYNFKVYTPEELLNRVCNRITCINLSDPGSVYSVSSPFFRYLFEHDLLDDCCFCLRVEGRLFNYKFFKV